MISVIIPMYNAQNYIEKCVESIINQTYKNIEIIVIDDGSTDASLKLCKKYQLIDDRIHVYSQKNRGPVVARKKGIELSKGEYITFVDADDYIEPEMYSNLFTEIHDTEYDFIHTGYYQGDSAQTKATLEKSLKFDCLKEKEIFLCDYVLSVSSAEYISPSMWSKIYKRDFIMNCIEKVPDNLFFGEDLLFLCICISECTSLKCLNEAYYHYMDNDNSISHDVNMCKIGQMLELNVAMHRYLSNKYKGLKIKKSIDEYIKWNIATYMKHMTSYVINRYRLLRINECIGKKVVIYGAGEVGQDIYSQISKYSEIDIVDWVDNDTEIEFEYTKINNPKGVFEEEFDYIIIAIRDFKLNKEIYNELVAGGIAKEKIISGSIGV